MLLVACAALFVVACGNGKSAKPTQSPSRTLTSATVAPGSDLQPACGEERWPVKTLTDNDAGLITFAPAPASVDELRSMPAPQALPEQSRNAPIELTVYSVTAQAIEFKQEDDRDIHLIIAEPSNPAVTMITEFPDAQNCPEIAGAPHAQEMRDARATLIATFGLPPRGEFQEISGIVTVTGVGFFDLLHGQAGVAPNGIELHPVLAFSKQ